MRKRSSIAYLCLLRTNRTNWLFITCEESNARQDTDLSLVSFLPQGVLDLVLDSLWYGSLVGGMVRVYGCGKHTFAVPVGHLVLNQKYEEKLKIRITVE